MKKAKYMRRSMSATSFDGIGQYFGEPKTIASALAIVFISICRPSLTTQL